MTFPGMGALRLAIGGMTACVAITVAALPATADDTVPTRVVAEAAGTGLVPAPVAALGVVEEPVPLDASALEAVDPATGALSLAYGGEAGAGIGLGLPVVDGLRADGAHLVGDGGDDVEVAVVPTLEGAQVLLGLESKVSPETYDFALDLPAGFVPQLTEDGAVSVRDAAGAEVAYVEQPWAYDAEGVAVPTRFEVEGATLRQVVEHAGGGFAYPISADPKIKGCNWQTATCVTFSRSETRTISRQTSNAAGIGALCGFIPHTLIRIGCSAAFVPVWNSVKGTFARAAREGRCVEVKLNRLPPAYNLPIGWKVVGC